MIMYGNLYIINIIMNSYKTVVCDVSGIKD